MRDVRSFIFKFVQDGIISSYFGIILSILLLFVYDVLNGTASISLAQSLINSNRSDSKELIDPRIRYATSLKNGKRNFRKCRIGWRKEPRLDSTTRYWF